MAAGVVERWAPLGLAAMALVLVLLLIPIYEQRIAARDLARMEELGKRDAVNAAEMAILRERCARMAIELESRRQEVATLQASVFRLINEMTRAGVTTSP